MKRLKSMLMAVPVAGALSAGGPALASTLAPNVTQHHNHATRDGFYIDPAFTQGAAANLRRDLNFNGAISGNVYAQPLYLDNGPNGRALLIAVTESNNVYALEARDGSVVWQQNAGAPVPLSRLPCGDINPLGITGTPVIDLASRTLFFDAMTTPDGGATKRHLVYALDVDVGTNRVGWPVDINAAARFNGKNFTSVSQNQRGALGLLGGFLYVPYGGHFGDCSTYYGWIVGIDISQPANVLAWATGARGGGAWSVGGVASDGLDPFIATGNTFGATAWGGGEAIIRFQPGPVFSGSTNDYWAPKNWVSLDNSDTDLGGSGPLIVNVPGATPSELVVALGKDGNAYLLDRANLGGVSSPLASAHLSSSPIIQAAATYQTALGTYLVFNGNGTQLIAFRITPTNPPGISRAWSKNQNGRGSPFVTSTDGTNNVVVWGLGAEGDQRLHGFDGDTGAEIFNGGGASELMAHTRRFSTAIAARGRIYVATDNKVYAFTLPVPPILLTNPIVSQNGAFEFGFTNSPGLSFTAYSATNLFAPTAGWEPQGRLTEISPGQFHFSQPLSKDQQRYYRVISP